MWRHKLDGDAAKASRLIRSEGLRVSSLCRGGWFSAPTAEERRKRIADNRVAIEEAALLGAPVLVIVSGPAERADFDRMRVLPCWMVCLEVLPDAEKAGVVLGIEPLHPMYAAERSVVVTLKQANDIVDKLSSRAAGVVVDAFHVWWDPEVMDQIERARGKDRRLPCVRLAGASARNSDGPRHDGGWGHRSAATTAGRRCYRVRRAY